MTGSIVDLSLLPIPKVIEEVNFEVIYRSWLSDLQLFDPELYATVMAAGESEPCARLLLVAAYREMVLRQRINEAATANMLAYANDTDLDNLVAREPYNISRLEIAPGNPEAIPPIDPVMESDDELRRRAQLAPSKFSTAGPEDAYVFHALSADGQVLDASAISPSPGQVVVTILSRQGNGAPSEALLDKVRAYFNALPVRPFTDELIIQGAEILEYIIEADLTLYEGPDQDVVLQTAQDRVQAYRDQVHKLGMDVARSGIEGGAHCQGVQNVALISPSINVVTTKTQAAFCTGITLTPVGRDD